MKIKYLEYEDSSYDDPKEMDLSTFLEIAGHDRTEGQSLKFIVTSINKLLASNISGMPLTSQDFYDIMAPLGYHSFEFKKE
jgi:hypothetical protein